MKYIKYLTLVLFVGLFAACSDKDVTYDMTQANPETHAYIQIEHLAPIPNTAANYAYQVDINGYEYQNDLSAVLLTRNAIPSGGTNLFFSVPAGSVEVKLHGIENILFERDNNGVFYVNRYYEKIAVKPGDKVYFVAGDKMTYNGKTLQGEQVYEAGMAAEIVGKGVRDEKLNQLTRIVKEPYYVGTTQDLKGNPVSLEPGKQYRLVIYDMSKGLLVCEQGDIPTIKDATIKWDSGRDDVDGEFTEIIGEGANHRFYNFVWETSTQPATFKLQAYFKNQLTEGDNAGAFDIPCGKPFGFGEDSGWATIPMKKSIYNSSGYARMDFKLKKIGPNGEDLGWFQYKSSNTAAPKDYTDYWTTYVGRAYIYFMYGIVAHEGIAAVGNQRWTAQ